MKNNTKVRLHLSKNLFESLAQQVLAESKKNYGAGMEEVKAPKKKKDGKAPEVKDTDDMKSMEEATPKPAAAPAKPATAPTRGASKGQVAQDLRLTAQDLLKRVEANIQAAEGGSFLKVVHKLLDVVDDKDNAAIILSAIDKFIDTRLKARTKPMEEMETRVAEEGEVNEDLPPGFTGMDPETANIAGMIMNLIGAGVGSAAVIAAINATKLGSSIKNKLISLVKKSPKS